MKVSPSLLVSTPPAGTSFWEATQLAGAIQGILERDGVEAVFDRDNLLRAKEARVTVGLDGVEVILGTHNPTLAEKIRRAVPAGIQSDVRVQSNAVPRDNTAARSWVPPVSIPLPLAEPLQAFSGPWPQIRAA